MVRVVGVFQIVLGCHLGVDGKAGVDIQYFFRVCRRLGVVVQIGATGGEKRVMHLIGFADLLDRLDRVLIVVADEIGAAQMAPKARRMIRV